MGKHEQSIDNKIRNRIYGHGRGWVFTPAHFADLGSRDAVASALKRYRRSGLIRQLARGLYDYPDTDPELGTLTPSPDALAKALAGRHAVRLQPSGAYAANLLGLSTQVPMKIVYLTDGPSRTVAIGKKQIILKRTTPRNMATAGRISGLIIQALRYLGKRHVDDDVFARLDLRLDDDDRKRLLKDLRFAPSWIADIMRRLGQKKETDTSG
ncbi:MAG: hypothetical protein JRJ09_15825 [Deltaproteobacteria bacterium]|nr:hypothetical protein [Deltaproteobacteria bacterium]MBW2113074.1 hypothetical protein [Deltaproteobacteria bacterium]